MYLIILCCVIVAQFSSIVAKPKAIMGGVTAIEGCCEGDVQNKFPYMVRLIIKGYKPEQYQLTYRLCGGILLANNAVLTAAHCLTWSYGRPEVLVTAGISHLNFTTTEGQSSFMHDYLIHEKYLKEEDQTRDTITKLQDDIAIVWLKDHFDYDKNTIKSSILYDISEVEGKTGLVLGWGETKDEGLSFLLQKGALEVISQEKCKKFYPSLHFTEEMMCAVSDTNNTMSCVGDDGGAFVMNDKVVALISFNTLDIEYDGVKDCDPSQPAVMTSLQKYRTWIKSHLELGAPRDRWNSIFKLFSSSNASDRINSISTGLLLLFILPLILIAF